MRITVLALMSSSSFAHAAAVINFGDNESLSIGLGTRASVTFNNNGAPSGGSSTDFNLDSIRLYLNGQLTKAIGATFNTERDSHGNIEVLDGYARFEPKTEFNIWVGRMLPPSDRSNLDGPYYLSSYNYPGVVSQYPAKFDGRDDGVTVWGKLFVVGIGKFQPVVRYQEADATLTHVTTKQTDASLNYTIKGHNARLSIDYAHTTVSNAQARDAVTAGVQLQF